MADLNMQSSTSTLSMDKDLPGVEKPSVGDIFGEDDSDAGDRVDGGDLEKQNQDLEKASSKLHPPAALDWDGPNDPEDPLNWPLGKKILHVVVPAMISLTA
jgi:hypothetical protein